MTIKLQNIESPCITFVLEHERVEEQTPEENALLNAIAFQGWFTGAAVRYRVDYGYGHPVGLSVIPVGSLEFTNRLLADAGFGPLGAINVPEALNTPQFLRRRIWRFPTFVDAVDSGSLPATGYIVKPDDTPKKFDTAMVQGLRHISATEFPADSPVFISEVHPEKLVAEWRIFVFRGEIIDAKPYILDAWTAPDKNVVQAMILAWKDAPQAYTLDVAVLEGGDTILIEAHNFVACGLYGLDTPRLPAMLTAAWRWELQNRSDTPIRIRMLKRTGPDAIPGLSSFTMAKEGTYLLAGAEYDAVSNPHGAVCGICSNGELLGVRPGEFEFVSAPKWLLSIYNQME